MENEQALATCWFCGKQRADADSAAEVGMHRPIKYDRSAPEWLGLRDGWEPATVQVPRCPGCKAVHDRTEGQVGRGALAGLLVGLPLAALVLFYVLRERQIPIFFFRWLLVFAGIVVGAAMVGGIIGWALGRAASPKGVKDQGLAAAHPNVRHMEREGWKIGGRPLGDD